MRFKIDNKIGIGEIVAFVAIIFSLFNLIRGCSLQTKLDNQDYITRANQFRPLLTVSKNPEIIDYYMMVDDIKKTKSGARIEGYSYISTSIELKNSGNSKANILQIITVDTLSYNDKLRTNLLKENQKWEKIENSENRFLEILPGQTEQITVSKKIDFAIDNIINLHILIFYFNDITGYINLYDTYMWFEYELPATTRLKEKMKINKGSKVYVPVEEIQFISKIESSKVYNYEEAKKIFNNYYNEQ